MTEQTTLALIALVLCLGVPVFMVAVIGFLIGVFMLIARQSQALARPEALERDAARLVPWGPAAFSGLAAEWRGTYASWPGRFGAAGYGPLRADLERAGFLFSYRRGGGEHVLQARTSLQAVRLSFGDDSATLYVDERLLGVIRLSTGELFDAVRQPVGECRRAAGLELFVNGVPIGRRHRAYPFTLNGRSVARLTTVAGRGWRGEGVPLVTELAPDLTAAEADWLLALCVLEVGYYGSRRARSTGRGV